MSNPSPATPTSIPAAAGHTSAGNTTPSQSWAASNSFSSSPRPFPQSDLPDPILEEEAIDESGSESAVEPVTPTSGRQSQDFAFYQRSGLHDSNRDAANDTPASPTQAAKTLISSPEPNSLLHPESSVSTAHDNSFWRPATSSTSVNPSAASDQHHNSLQDQEQEAVAAPLSRRSTRGSTSSFKRTMSNIFRRSTSQVTATPADHYENSENVSPSETNGAAQKGDGKPANSSAHPNGINTNGGPPPSRSSRRFSMNRSSTTTRSNTPPSPTSPVDISANNGNDMLSPAQAGSLPTESDFGMKKKNRSSTGLSLRGRAVNFVGSVGKPTPRHKESRRANSFDSHKRGVPGAHRPKTPGNDEHTHPPERLPWPLPPDAGTGAKARRMSLSLPDDFTIDVAELQTEYEYQSKLLGRHGKHLGKGAASKVTLMQRKGYPEELYAVKEFRGKSNRESREDYEKKIKSEYSIAKSLHHPNIVETIRLCTDHSRWNHVMEYCGEGDLFGLVQKGYLKSEGRQKDRLCLFKQLIQGVSYLHANGIAHRDIKLENLLITKDSKLKITDFGVSEVFSGTHPGLREARGQCGQNMGEVRLCSPGICGSEPYIAPEVLAKQGEYDPRLLDVWSSAIIMIYLTFGGAIWTRAEAGHAHYDRLVRGWDKWYAKHPDSDASISDSDYPHFMPFDIGVNPPALRRLLLQMLNPCPEKRISMAQVANNRWLKNVECCQLESYDDPALNIDATKMDTSRNGYKRIFCHSHLPAKSQGTSLGKMPGEKGY